MILNVNKEFFFEIKLNEEWLFRIERVETHYEFPPPEREMRLKYKIHFRLFVPVKAWHTGAFEVTSEGISAWPEEVGGGVFVTRLLYSINPNFESIIMNKIKEFSTSK